MLCRCKKEMDANLCDDNNHLDSDVHLPPRKRLLAGLKKHSPLKKSSPSRSTTNLSEFDLRLNNLLRTHLNDPNASTEEIVEASKSAAMAATRMAAVARAAANDKALKASKALAAAKDALELVAAMPVEETSSERLVVKYKAKKQYPVKNCRTDEELARRLHQAINSSPRISGHPSTSELKGNKTKRPKGITPEITRVQNRRIMWEGFLPTTSNGNGNGNVLAAEVNSEGLTLTPKPISVIVNGHSPKTNNADGVKMDNGEAHTSQSMEKSDDTNSVARKRGRIKQKKLLLSNCTIRDQENPKGENEPESSPSTEETNGKSVSDNSRLLALVETTSLLK